MDNKKDDSIQGRLFGFFVVLQFSGSNQKTKNLGDHKKRTNVHRRDKINRDGPTRSLTSSLLGQNEIPGRLGAAKKTRKTRKGNDIESLDSTVC